MKKFQLSLPHVSFKIVQLLCTSCNPLEKIKQTLQEWFSFGYFHSLVTVMPQATCHFSQQKPPSSTYNSDNLPK